MVHVRDDLRLGGRQCRRWRRSHLGLRQPADLAEASHQMSALDRHPVEAEVGKCGVQRGIGMARQEAGPRPGIVVRHGAAHQRDAGTGQGLVEAGGAVEQQRDPVVRGNGLAVLGQGADQQDRREVVVQRDQDQRGIRPRYVLPAGLGGQHRRQRRLVQPADQVAHAVRYVFRHVGNKKSRNSSCIDGRSGQRQQPPGHWCPAGRGVIVSQGCRRD